MLIQLLLQAASALSKNFKVILTYCFEKMGVLEDINDENSVIPFIDTKKYHELKKHRNYIPRYDA